ncbi:MAG: EamA family transporter [Thermoleophilia bacterium]|nr:EamA family transporter [Thermoleophilia bacterium]MDH5333063.1 EamA family transporter [Thermoleophilia bacterium]
MPATALLLALGAAFLHAAWNLMLAGERDPEAATAIAMCASVITFGPVAALTWDVEPAVWPFVAVTSLLQLVYFALLARAYRRTELSFVYPIARGGAPVVVLVVSVVVLGATVGAAQAAGVCLVGLGVVLVRGLSGRRDAAGLALGLVIASVIASYTLVDKSGIRHADPVAYLELGMAPASTAFLLALWARPGGSARLVAALRPRPVAAGLVSFAAYVLVLAALTRAAAAPVAAVRETSVLIAAALAAPLLGERVGAGRLVGAGVVVGGVALVTLGA